MKKLARFLDGVRKEMKRVRWPNRKELLTYSTVTIVFIATFCIFFGVLDIVLSSIKTLVG